jgi:hypothetical protein
MKIKYENWHCENFQSQGIHAKGLERKGLTIAATPNILHSGNSKRT